MNNFEADEIAKFTFRHPLRVRWSEADPQGLVFNGHFLTYYDVAMTEYMRAIDFPYPQGLTDAGMDLHIRKSTLEWLAPVRYDEEIEILTRISRIGWSSLTFHFVIRHPAKPMADSGHGFEPAEPNPPLAQGESVYVNVLVATRTPESLPAAFTQAIRRFEGAALES